MALESPAGAFNMATMATTYAKLSPARRALMMALMVALLGLTVLGAWGLQVPPARRVRAAAAMLQELRRAGLQQYWPEGVRIEWHLIRAGSKPLGWSGTVTGTTEDGQLASLQVELRPTEGLRLVESRTLDAHATEGRYHGVVEVGRERMETRIALKKGNVHVRTSDNRASAVAPVNYMPEGLFGVLLRLVAAKRADVQFKLIFDDRQNVPGKVRFDTLRMRYVGSKARPGGAVLDIVRVSGVRTERGYAATYELDQTGAVVRRALEGTGLVWERSSTEDIGRHFPRAPVQLVQALRVLQPGLYRRLERSVLEGLQGPVSEGVGPPDKLRI